MNKFRRKSTKNWLCLILLFHISCLLCVWDKIFHAYLPRAQCLYIFYTNITSIWYTTTNENCFSLSFSWECACLLLTCFSQRQSSNSCVCIHIYTCFVSSCAAATFAGKSVWGNAVYSYSSPRVYNTCDSHWDFTHYRCVIVHLVNT